MEAKFFPAKDAEQWLTAAAEAAKKALCGRASCGSVIVKNGQIIGEGYNAPPQDDAQHQRCDKKHELKPGFKSDRTCCVHAEQRAVMDALKRGEDLSGSTLYFCRVDEAGNRLPSGHPYCTICSKMALDAGVSFWVLEHPEDFDDPERCGPTCYEAGYYNELSFDYNGQ